MDDARYRPGPAVGTLALLAATAAALLSAGGGQDGRASQEPATAGLAEVAVEATPRTARRVERLRELAFDAVPTAEVVAAAHLGRLERRELRRGHAPSHLAADEATARITGLLDDDEELENALGSSEQLAAAAYDPRTDRLYVIEDAVSAEPSLVEFILAHELTHALEDQHYGLADPALIRNDDSALARLALTEGTATALMVDYGRLHLNPLELALAELDSGTGDVPAFVLDQLKWTYLGGMRFVNRLRDLAGGWNLVDYSLRERPPASTEQVLHPLAYVRDEGPLPVTIDAGELRRRGWRRADAGVVGEFSSRLLLELGGSPRAAARAAAGWGGDRYELWRAEVAPSGCAETCRGDLVLVMRWRMDSPGDAGELADALERYGEEGLDGAVQRGAAMTVAEGALAVGSRKATAVAVFAPGAALARAVAAEQLSG